MNVFVALLRGINVGGHNKLLMRELVQLLESLELSNVKTYIQSGNVVFQTERTDQVRLGGEIRSAVEQRYGFAPQVMVFSLADLETAVARNPFANAQADPKTLHFYFLEVAPPNPDLAALEALKTEQEQFQLIDNVFYLHAQNGIGRSKLAAKVERALGVAVTARNWRSVSKVLEMATAVSAL